VYVRTPKEKPLELSASNLVHMYSMAGPRHTLTLRSKDSRSNGYENHHVCTVTSERCPLLQPCDAAAGLGLHVLWLLKFLVGW